MSLPQDERLATMEEVAEHYHFTPGALRVQRYRNISPGNLGVKVGARVLYDPATLRAWFRAQEQAQIHKVDDAG